MHDKPRKTSKPADKLLEQKLPFSPHFLTPAGMLLPKHQQPPPMYGPRGATVPPKFIPKYENVSTQPNFRGRGRGGGGGRGGRGRGGHSQHPRKPFNNNQEAVLPPRNWDLWCESCDRDFHSKDLLEKHKSEHTTCGIDGCKFVGHPAIVQKHVVQQHESGLFEKLKNLETPEDIMKWREERKKKYPTQANIELKQKAREARKDRGEKLEESKAKFNKNQKKPNNRKNNKQKKQQQGNRPQNGGPKQIVSVPIDEEEINQGIRMFKGTSGMWDDEEVVDVPEESKEVDQNPLLKLIGMYGDSDESEMEDEPAPVPEIVSDPPKEESPKAELIDPQNQPEDKIAVPNPIEKIADMCHPVPTSNTPANTKKTSPGKRKHVPDAEDRAVHAEKQKVIKSGLNYNTLRKTKPNTLLFKLLQGEIRHERNVLLQAVRFVVANNFLDDKGTTEESG